MNLDIVEDGNEVGQVNNFGDTLALRLRADTKIKGFIFQAEKGTHYHLQGYATAASAMPFAWWRQLLRLPRYDGGWRHAHLEKALGNHDQNIRYCSKEETRVVGTTQWFSDAAFILTKGQGKRNDLDRIASMIREGKKMKDVALAHAAPFMRYGTGIERYYHTITTPRQPGPVTTLFLRGPTGFGKTKGALRFMSDVIGLEREEYYIWSNKQGKNWWDNYDGQEWVMLDELERDAIAINDLLRIFEPSGLPFEVPIHGGRRHLRAHCFIITSNQTLDQVIGDKCDAGRRDALKRRVREVNLDIDEIRAHRHGLCNLESVSDGLCNCVLLRDRFVCRVIEREWRAVRQGHTAIAEREAAAAALYEASSS